VATFWESESSAAELQASPTYLDTVAAIQRSGFLLPPQSTELLVIHGGTFPT